MLESGVLPAVREKYWKNRLSNRCILCKKNLITAKTGFFWYQTCGHSACVNCHSDWADPMALLRSFFLNCKDCKKRAKYVNKIDVVEDNAIQVTEYQKEVSKTKQSKHDALNLKREKESLANSAKKLEIEAKALRQTLQSRDKTQAEMEEEISRLNEKCWTLEKVIKDQGMKESEEKAVATHCMDCGYIIAFERSRLCISCGISNELLTVDEEDQVTIVSFEKAEASLLCGLCILETEHGSHRTVNYFQLKMDQLSVSHKLELSNRLGAAFDKDWDTICQKMNQCHLPIVELLTNGNKHKQENWMKFKNMQIKQNHIAQCMADNKTNMVGYMHEYTGQMKALLNDARSILQDLNQVETVESDTNSL